VDEDHLIADMIELARQFGRYGYRRIAALPRNAGWSVSDVRVERRAIDAPLVRVQWRAATRGAEGSAETAKEGAALVE
jgi:hypothetical protein